MLKKDINIRINVILLEMALKKIETDFGKKYTKTDCMLIIMMLALYKHNNSLRTSDNVYLAIQHPDQLTMSFYKTITIAVYDGLLDMLQKQYPQFTQSQLIESAIADYLVLPITFYTDCISPLYSIVGSKNHTMQKATASAVDAMKLPHESLTLIDACCATGSLFFGLHTYPWKQVVLNDLNPLRTNFLNVIKREPLRLIKKILNTDLAFIEQSTTRISKLRVYRINTDQYVATRQHYNKVDCNINIAYEMFLLQCISKQYMETSDKILNRVLRFLPAHLKLRNAIITQDDCLKYLENHDINKLVLLDVPYIGSEHTCAIRDTSTSPSTKR